MLRVKGLTESGWPNVEYRQQRRQWFSTFASFLTGFQWDLIQLKEETRQLADELARVFSWSHRSIFRQCQNHV
jgi:hypothetical protein